MNGVQAVFLKFTGGLHGVLQTLAPRAIACWAIKPSPSSMTPPGAIRVRNNESPAPVLVEKSKSASEAENAL